MAIGAPRLLRCIMLKRPVTVRVSCVATASDDSLWSGRANGGRRRPNPYSTPLRAGTALGLKVEDSDGQKDGTVRNLVIDTLIG